MRFGFKQPLVGERPCVTTLIMAEEETKIFPSRPESRPAMFCSKYIVAHHHEM